MAWKARSTIALALALAAASLAEAGVSPPPTLTLELEGSPVVFTPTDPRSPELAAAAPDAASLLYEARLTDGSRSHLVAWDDTGLGILSRGGALEWLVLEQGRLTAFSPPPVRDAEHIDEEVEAPHGPEASVASEGSPDGVLQILLDADAEFYFSASVRWDLYQLAVIHLVEAIYMAQLDVEFEVTEQHAWKDPETQPLTATYVCAPVEEELLGQFRMTWEAISPTNDDPREVAHLFSGKEFEGSVIGCGYIRGLENSAGYAVSQMAGTTPLLTPTILHRDTVLVAHEIGHNFDGRHSRAIPTPGGGLDPASCLGPVTIMYPCLANNLPHFSDARDVGDPLPGGGLVRDGGNVRFMDAYATPRI